MYLIIGKKFRKVYNIKKQQLLYIKNYISNF